MRKVTIYFENTPVKSFEYEWGEIGGESEDYKFYIGQSLVAIVPKEKYLIIIQNER
jgi:hypothetical protein